MDVSSLSKRVDALLSTLNQTPTIDLQNASYHGTLSLMQAIYGSNSSQEQALSTYLKSLREKVNPSNPSVINYSILAIKGTIASIKAELDSGFIGTLRGRLTGETLTDFIKLARAVLEKPTNDAKNVAAVLSAAAFEDVIRRLAELKGGKNTEKLADVLIWLKDMDVLQGSEVGIAQSYLSFRNRALHAKWDEVDLPSVQSVLAFTEQIILKNFT
jgi:hypothetical protein